MHTICGYPIPEEEQTRGQCFAQRCNDCGDQKQAASEEAKDDNHVEEEAKEDVPHNTRNKKQRRPAKQSSRAKRPKIVYEDTTADATNWVFPTNQPDYYSPFLEFMGFLDNKKYVKGQTFTKARLLKIYPKHVLAYLTYKAFGTTKRTPQDRPKYGRASHIGNIKMKISHFMPSGAAWVELANGKGHGNPTRHKSINALIAEIVQFETRGEGAPSQDVRPLTIAEFEKELELLRKHKDPVVRKRNPLIGIYQFHFITRADDVCNFMLSDPKGNDKFPFCLSQSVRWSKNVRDSRNCPDQVLMASMDYNSCIFVALALWLEHFLHHHPGAEFMMTEKTLPPSASKKERSTFIKAIIKTYRNRVFQLVYKKPEFESIYQGNDQRGLGVHSKRKMGSTQAKKRGASGEQVDHRGRWVSKKGSRIVNQVYIDPEDEYADAFVGARLCLGSAIKYKLRANVESRITTDWLAEKVIPNIARRYSRDRGIIRNLGLAMLFVMLDEEASASLFSLSELPMVEAVKKAYDDIELENKPEQPVERVPIHVYRIGEETFIDEVWQDSTQQQQGNGNNPEANLAQIPASGGGAATQQILQTLLIQNQQLQRQIQEQEQRMDLLRQTDRAWLEDKLRRINDNVKRFGGTIGSSLARQHPARRQQQAQEAEEEATAARVGTTINRDGRQWPALCPNVNSLLSLWTDYEFGIGGRKPAKAWKPAERGNKTQKQTYYRRNCLWKIQLHLVNKGYRIEAANALIRRTYGESTSITNMATAIVADRKTYKDHGGLHPNFR